MILLFVSCLVEMMPCLHNYITVDTPAFLANPKNMEVIYNICKKVWFNFLFVIMRLDYNLLEVFMLLVTKGPGKTGKEIRNLATSLPASSSRERSEARESAGTTVFFRVLLSRDFSRLPQMEGLLAGYLITVEPPLATTLSANT